MTLTMRPTGLGSGFHKDNVDYGIFCGEWCIGRIYETRTGPKERLSSRRHPFNSSPPQPHASRKGRGASRSAG